MPGTQLHKVLTHAKGGHRLGTSSATWNKIKQAAAESKSKNTETIEGLGASEKRQHTKESVPQRLVESGPNGEVCIWYGAQETYEIWSWQAVESYSMYREDGSLNTFDFYSSTPANGKSYSGDTLTLVSQFEAPGRSVVAMAFMTTDDSSVFISAYSRAGRYYLEARAGPRVREILLPVYLLGKKLQLKASLQFLVVASSDGFLYILKYSADSESLFVDANNDGSLQSVYSHSTRAIIEKDELKDTSSKTILLKTGTFDGSAIYDIVGTWLVYCPKRLETEYYKNLMRSTDDSCTKAQSSVSRVGGMYTSVKLPPKGPLLFRAASSLANSAIDRIFKLSQIGTKRMKNYWNPDSNFFEKDISLQTISNSVSKALYSTASKIKKQADMIGENEIIKIVDLSNGQIMATFKPPGGISHLSLSEYDLLLAQATYRGDNFYLWDLYKLPLEVSFVGKFARGKTSAVIKEIFWLVNNKTLGELLFTNSGFGCITEKTGSIHWYNINYLFCANENDNYPNTLELLSQTVLETGQFLDSWILPSMNAVKPMKIPGFSNMPNNMTHDGTSVNSDPNLRRCNQLAFVDTAFNLRLVSPLNGKHTFKYKLNDKPVDIDYCEGPSYSTWCPLVHIAENDCLESPNFDTPLSQMEIETCVPFPGITKDRNVTISSYVFDGNESAHSFWNHFATFGNEVPQLVHEFVRSDEYDTPSTSSENLAEHLKEGLIINPGVISPGIMSPGISSPEMRD